MIPFDIWFLAKILVMFALVIYIVFAGVVVRQIYVMTNTVKVGLEMPLRLISWLHLFITLAIFLLALVTL